MATLVSLNVGLPKDVSWNGRTVHTGAWKAPVAGPRMVRTLNVEGDGQGDLEGHGGENRAVLVYQLDSYRYWSDVLGRQLLPGDFGENFTVDGLPDDKVCIGDRYQVGDALIEVTQPRVTCYRLGLRLAEPKMAALLVAHRRPGFYCRVLREGAVSPGEQIAKVVDGPESVTVAEVDALLYLPGHPHDALARALRIPALSRGWQMSLRALLDDAESGTDGNSGLTGSNVGPPAWSGFRPLRVVQVSRASANVSALTLADAEPLPRWLAGQSIAVRIADAAGGGPLIRNYSLSNDPASGHYRIGVKREELGAVSRRISDQVSVGDTLEVAAPRGAFVLDGSTVPVVLISAGVGVTPTLAMLHAVAATDPQRQVWWLHGARDGSEHPFAAEVREILQSLPHSHSRVYYSRPTMTDKRDVDYDEEGRISADALNRLDLPTDAQAYLCGPATFMAELSAALVEYGLTAANIHTEAFGAQAALNPGIRGGETVAPHAPPGAPGPGPVVQFARSGVAGAWAPRYASLLEFAEACDVPTRWSCRTGVCHNCETSVISGDVEYVLDPLDAPAPGRALLCIATPRDDMVLDL